MRATRNSFQAEMKVKISAVTMPGAASGSVIRSRAPTRPRPSTMAASSSSTGIEEKKALSIHTAKARLKPALTMIERQRRGQAEVDELALDADQHGGRLEHLGGEHEQQEGGAAAEPAARGAVGGGQRDEQHDDGGAGGDLQAGADAAAQAAVDHRVVKFEKVQCFGKMVARPSSLFGRSGHDEHLEVRQQEDDGDDVGRDGDDPGAQRPRRLRAAGRAVALSRGAGLVVVIIGRPAPSSGWC